MSDAVLMSTSVIHADSPSSPLARTQSRARWQPDNSIVEDKLQEELQQKRVDATRRQLHKRAQALRDHALGRSPKNNPKSVLLRAKLIEDNFGMSPQKAHAHANKVLRETTEFVADDSFVTCRIVFVA